MDELQKVLFKAGLKQHSRIIIDVHTGFKKITEKDFAKDNNVWEAEDLTKQVEKDFHDAVLKYIEEQITENDDFENEILGALQDNNQIPDGFDEFSKLGNISIRISQEELKAELESEVKTQ
jgi:hypothetical protein